MDGGVNLTDYPGVGAYGGSLGYSCSNSNPPYDGLYGGYLGLGIDEYGNFLNGYSNTLGELAYSVDKGGNRRQQATGDFFYKPGRIGLRGAGHISWKALNNHYGTNPNETTKPYYPSSLTNSTFERGGGSASTRIPEPTARAGRTRRARPSASPTPFKTEGASATGQRPGNRRGRPADSCPAGGEVGTFRGPCPVARGPDDTAAPGAARRGTLAVQKTCRDKARCTTTPRLRRLPAAGATSTLANTANTAAPRLRTDPGRLHGAHRLYQIANEAAVTRADGTPIFYNLKITQDGLLSFAYSISGAYQSVISKQSIRASNGPPPAPFGSVSPVQLVAARMFTRSCASRRRLPSVGQLGRRQREAVRQDRSRARRPTSPTTIRTAGPAADGQRIGSTPPDGGRREPRQLGCGVRAHRTVGPSTAKAALHHYQRNGPVAAQAPRIASSSPGIQGPVGIAFKWANLNSAQQAALDRGRRGNGRHRQSAELPAGRPHQRDQFFGRGTVSCARERPRRHRRLEPDLGRSAASPYTANWEDRFNRVSMPENSRTDLSAVRLERANASQRRVLRSERRHAAWLPCRQFRQPTVRRQRDDAQRRPGSPGLHAGLPW